VVFNAILIFVMMLNMKLINYSKTVAVVFPSQKYKEPATLVVSRDRPIYQPGISG